jgi:putative tricarboxylic transport membrane protein
MTVIGLLLGIVGSDIETGTPRFTFGLSELDDGVEIVALALGLVGIAEFMSSVNQTSELSARYSHVQLRDMRPSKADLKQALWPMLRRTIVGSLCSLIPGTGPTIASFVAYAAEKKASRTPERFGHGAIEGVACPEAATHSSVQGDFTPNQRGAPGGVRSVDRRADLRTTHPRRRRPNAEQVQPRRPTLTMRSPRPAATHWSDRLNFARTPQS